MKSFSLVKAPNSANIIYLEGQYKTIENHQEHLTQNGFLISRFGLNQPHLLLATEEQKTISTEEILQLKLQPNTYTIKENTTDKAHYLKIVEQAIVELKKITTTLKKIVLANSKSTITSISPFELFISLVNKYPNSFVYLTQIDAENTWIGASPELLINALESNRFKTMSLAGTLINKESQWTDKEKEEQAFVTNYIVEALAKESIDVETNGPNEVSNGHLRHLQSEIIISGTNLNPFKLIRLLHPTPAINGIPKKEAFEFIQEHEKYKRGFYSGTIGLVQTEKTLVHVNLRCARIATNGITLYAGAGITKDSVAEKEWVETQNKMKIIADLL